jgi:ADP-heptose:LPS heptosyltransferase
VAGEPAAPRILLARPDHLGDMLLTLPALALLRRALPQARITALVSPAVAAVPQHCPDLDATCTAPFPPLTSWPAPPGWPETADRVAATLRGRFDLAILPRPDDPVTGALLAAAGIPVRLGYACPRTAPFLTVALPAPPRRHVAALACDLVRAAAHTLGARWPADSAMPAPRYFVPTPADEAEAATALAQVRARCGPHPILIHPAAGWPLKNWPPARWAALAAGLRARYGVAPLVVCGPDVREIESAILDLSMGAACGLGHALSLGALAAVQQQARLVVGIDSGPVHLAALLGTPVISLFGPADPREFRPWCPPDRYRIVRVPLACSPCGTLMDPPCGATRDPACMTGITVEAVLAAVGELSTQTRLPAGVKE